MLNTAHYACLALAMLVLAVYGSLIPFQYTPCPLNEALVAFRHISFHDPADLEARGDWVVSVVLFLALSYLLMATLCVDRRRPTGIWAAPAVIVFCTLLSLTIEFAQLYFPPRTVSLNDIAVETAGGVVGTLVWLLAGQHITGWMRRVMTPTGITALAGRLLPGYIALLLIIELMPFDLTVSPVELRVKLHEGKIWLIPFATLAVQGLSGVALKAAMNVACFLPLGFLRMLAAQSQPSAGGAATPRKGWLGVVLFGLAATASIELLQLLVYSRVCDMTDIITGTAAVLAGWWLGQLFLARWRLASSGVDMTFLADDTGHWGRRAAFAGVILVWFGGVLCVNWKPFDFTTDPAKFAAVEAPEELPVWGLRRMSLLPLVDYYWGSKYQALDQFLKKTVAFLPLGILCALASPRLYRPRAVLITIALALFSALVIETGRYFLPTHTASVTDVLLQCGGAWIGFRLTQYVRALLWVERAGLIGIRF